jgi:hypothetical protein
MTVVTYAISHKDTGSILSHCMLADQKLTDAASAQALLDRLVGASLVISLNTTGTPSFKFQKADLAVDQIAVDVTTQGDFYPDPFLYVLSLPDATSRPGDGKVKTITNGGTRTLVLNTATGGLKVTLPTSLGPTTNMIGAVEGQAPVAIALRTPNAAVEIPLGGTFSAGHAYAVMFLGQGLKSSIELLKA